MAIELQRFASGDTDYIAKMNADMAVIEAAINALQLAAGTGTGTGSSVDLTVLYTALWGTTTTLIGRNSYKPVVSGTSVVIAAGYVYKGGTQTLLSTAGTTISLVGQTLGTYYIVPDATGAPTLSGSDVDAVYSLYWSGTEITSVTRVCKATFDKTEQDDARNSTAMATNYGSLDDRLEAMETRSYTRIRKIGLSLDGGGQAITTGVKGMVQVDFMGTIIGWSLIADREGSIEVAVSRASSSPPAIPPADPPIPNTTTDKISASAPIALSAGQSASGGVSEVSTWGLAINQWDTILFNVISVSALQKVTLYLRVRES